MEGLRECEKEFFTTAHPRDPFQGKYPSGSSVTVLPAFNNGDYTIPIESPCSHSAVQRSD